MVASADSPEYSLFTDINCTQIAIWTNTYFGTVIDEGSGEPVQMCRLVEAFAASIWDLDTYRIVQWPLVRVFAAGVNSRQIAYCDSTWDFLYSDEG